MHETGAMDAQNYVAVVLPLDGIDRPLSALRQRHIKTPAVALPAHITLIPKLCAPDELDAALLGRIEDALRGTPAFEIRLSEVRRFEAAQVVYLALEPPAPVVALARTIADACDVALDPEHTFHVTVAHRPDDMDTAEAQVRRGVTLPIVERAARVAMYAKSRGAWGLRQACALAPGAATLDRPL